MKVVLLGLFAPLLINGFTSPIAVTYSNRQKCHDGYSVKAPVLIRPSAHSSLHNNQTLRRLITRAITNNYNEGNHSADTGNSRDDVLDSTTAKQTQHMRNKNDKRWDDRLQQLQQYKEKTGNCNVPSTFVGLGKWVNRQRVQFNQGNLKEDRLRQLKAVGFSFNPHEDAWDQSFQELKQYIQEHGDSLVPETYAVNIQLGKWTAYQRTLYQDLQNDVQRDYPKGVMTPRRLKLLADVGFIFDAREHQWQQMYKKLEVYAAAHGDCLVPAKYESDLPLASWVHKQRNTLSWKCKREEQTQTDIRRIELLNRLDFIWEPREYRWYKRYDELKAFQLEHGHLNVHYYQPLKLWINAQRSNYHKYLNGKQSFKNRVDALNEIGFDWSRAKKRRAK